MDSQDYNIATSDNLLGEGGKQNILITNTYEMNLKKTNNNYNPVDLVTPSIADRGHIQATTNNFLYDETHLLGSQPVVDLLIDDMDESLLNTPSKGV